MNGENIDPFVPNAKTMYTKGSSELASSSASLVIENLSSNLCHKLSKSNNSYYDSVSLSWNANYAYNKGQ